MYVETINYVLNQYATNDVIVEAASKIGLVKNFSNWTAIQLAEALKNKAL